MTVSEGTAGVELEYFHQLNRRNSESDDYFRSLSINQDKVDDSFDEKTSTST